MIRILLVVGLLLGAVGAGVAALTRADDLAEPRGTATALGTPLWSARRVPQPFVDAVGAARLQGELDAALANTDACVNVLTAAGPVATRAADVPYIGASTQKLLTGAAALAVLGADTTLTTRVVGSEPANGTVERLALVGGGDPLLSTAEFRALLDADPKTAGTPHTALETLADALVARGVRRVESLAVDDSRHDATRYLPVWTPNYRAEGQVGPLGALTVNRGFSALRPRPIAVDDPALFAGNELARLLRARGVVVSGAATRQRIPEGAVELAKVDSAPMRDIVAEVERSSDNLASELLVREIGVKQAKDGSTAAGLAAATQKLTELGVPMAGVTLADGSGLARDNRVTCRALAATVDLGARPELRSLWDGLAVAGQSGTLADELIGTGLEGRLRGKTGFLNGVTGLAGLVDVGRPLRFALVVNGAFGEAAAIRIRGNLAQIIAKFPDAPPADELVPAPEPPAPAPAGP